ncbi:PHP domain-containing protein [Herbiconiux moechotypicola]|uniref:PHP domain-containing protein n=1 Tax=Herbiconiux moechotypicola TaxID=637393 RepID=A0ABP5QI55_9MICO|nr:PHP domain-containing protein [Herbiconiux moechotypicola]MCS5729950.1 PHP domain-containing protein [Herbiconiux moechotypicola]
MDPLAAVEETAFLLERELAPGFKVKAFRRAAAVLAEWTPEEIAARASDGRLKATKGVGDRTVEIVTQALEGRVPDYLVGLRERSGFELDADAAALMEAIRGDLHSHSDWSDGTTGIPSMAAAARSLGREYLALTDHSPNLTVANGLSAERLEAELDVVDGLNEGFADGFRLLTGIEVDILDDGSLDQDPTLLEQLDVVVASVHSKLRADSRTMTERMLAAVSNPRTDVLGHCTGRLVQGSRGTRPPSEFDARAVFEACAANGVAVEINSRPERQDPPDELLALALELGCLFSIDSDAHAPGHLSLLDRGAARAAALGVPGDRIVTTWPLPRLLAWTTRPR